MSKLTRSEADCRRLQALHAKAAGFPYPPVNPAQAAAGVGWTLYQDAPVRADDGRWSYEMPTDAELSISQRARLSAAERNEIATIRGKPDT